MPKLIKNPEYIYGREIEYDPGFEGYTVPEADIQHATISGALKGLEQLLQAVASGRVDMLDALKNSVNYLNKNYALGLKFESLTDLPQLQAQLQQIKQYVNPSLGDNATEKTDYTKYILLLGGLAIVVILILFLLK
jgi:hypothetical protein